MVAAEKFHFLATRAVGMIAVAENLAGDNRLLSEWTRILAGRSKRVKTSMKLPRWLVVSLWSASVLVVLLFAGWWWVTWPERSVAQFNDRFELGEMESAEAMLQVAPDWNWKLVGQFPDEQVDRDRLLRVVAAELEVPKERTVLDIILARQEFRSPWSRASGPMRSGGLTILNFPTDPVIVERGTIKCIVR